MRFIHCADLHIGTPFASEGLEKGAALRKELTDALVFIVREAKKYKAELLFIAGDLFESEYVTDEEVCLVWDTLSTLENCRVIISPGNHDPYCVASPYTARSLPENIHIFRSEAPERLYFPELGLSVYGFGYRSPVTSAAPLRGFTHRGSEYGIFLAHGVIGTDAKYASISLKDIEASNLDYIALGHIHSSDRLHSAGKTKYMYCGNPVGRDFGECGRKGFILGELKDGLLDIKRVYLPFHRYEDVTVDISGCDSRAALETLIENECGDFDDSVTLRITLTGTRHPEISFTEAALGRLLPEVREVILNDASSDIPDLQRLGESSGIKGTVYDILRPGLLSDDESIRKKSELALRYITTAFASAKKDRNQ